MITKEFKISYGWTIVAHENMSIFSKIAGPHANEYILVDWDGDTILQVFADDFSIYLEPSMYGLKHKINAKNKVLTIYHEPDNEE